MMRKSLLTLAIPPTASYAEIVALLMRAQAPQVALLFPLHCPSPLAQAPLLDALRARSHQMGKSLLIIGGDEQLRACAVSVGLVAATTLDDWRAARSGAWAWDSGRHEALSAEYTTHPASFPQPATQPTGAHRSATTSAVPTQRTPLRLVERNPEGASSDPYGLYDSTDPWNADPPAYVSELLTEMRQRQQAYSQDQSQNHGQPYSAPAHAVAPYTVAPYAVAPYAVAPAIDPFTDSAEREALTREIERYEAAITDKIRITSAPVLTPTSHPSQPGGAF